MQRHSVSQWLEQLKAGDYAAARPLWERYYPKLVHVARARLAQAPRQMADEEDVALNAFASFCRDAVAGKLPQLDNRDNLWRVLLLLTRQKALDVVRHEMAAKRGGTHQAHAFDLDALCGSEPTPEWTALMVEELQRLLALLPDPALQQLALWKMEGLTDDEVAQRWDCVPRTVARRLRVIRSLWAGELTS